jgi:predicted GNAT family acetyltransferase
VFEEGLDVDATEDPDTFARLGGAWLASHAFDANVIGSNLAKARTYDPADRPDNLWFVFTDDSDEVAGVAMHTAGMAAFLPELPPGAAEAMAAILVRRNRRLLGANGDPEAARAFCVAWQGLTGVGWEQAGASILYVLDALEPPAGVPGGPRLATVDDLDQVTEWTHEFVAEAEAPVPLDDQRDLTTRRIAGAEVLLWSVDGEITSMAAVTASVGGVARVYLVYTPPHQRGRGYGSAVSAAATRTTLERGADACMLYADVANPISNAVYQRIGYREHSEAVELRFRT